MASIKTVCFLIYIICACSSYVSSFKHRPLSPPRLVWSSVVLDFDFGSDEQRQAALETKAFIPKNCFPNKVESYKGSLYVSTPRVFSGVPFSVVKIVERRKDLPTMEPFPNIGFQTLGDCNAIQMTLSFKIDPNTGIMWIIDTGRVLFPDADDPFLNSVCPAKVVAIKIRTRKEVSRFVFPESIVPAGSNILNDLVLDYVKGELAFLYIADSGSEALVVYDIKKHISFSVKHQSMAFDPTATVIQFHNELPPLQLSIGIDGIAMSCDFRYVYYHSLSGYDFYRIPTYILRNGGNKFDAYIEGLGRRDYVVDGMVYSTKHNLLFSVPNESALDRWLVRKDTCSQRNAMNITIESVQRLAQNDSKMEYLDALDINEKGVVYFMAHRLNRIFQNDLDITGGNGTNFHIWCQKLNRGERSYLWRAPRRTAPWHKCVSRRCDRLY